MELTTNNKDIYKATLDTNQEDHIVSSRLTKYEQLLEKNLPKRELTQKYQSQPSIGNGVEPKTLSHRSSDKSTRRK